MKLEEFTEEMLSELKSAKDLLKGEFPEIVKEYIRANKIMNRVGLAIGAVLFLIGVGLGLHAYNYVSEHSSDNTQFGCCMAGLIIGLPGLVVIFTSGYELASFSLQPRRMAIKAITSLKGD